MTLGLLLIAMGATLAARCGFAQRRLSRVGKNRICTALRLYAQTEKEREYGKAGSRF
jgi:hypothetical protein